MNATLSIYHPAYLQAVKKNILEIIEAADNVPSNPSHVSNTEA